MIEVGEEQHLPLAVGRADDLAHVEQHGSPQQKIPGRGLVSILDRDGQAHRACGPRGAASNPPVASAPTLWFRCRAGLESDGPLEHQSLAAELRTSYRHRRADRTAAADKSTVTR